MYKQVMHLPHFIWVEITKMIAEAVMLITVCLNILQKCGKEVYNNNSSSSKVLALSVY